MNASIRPSGGAVTQFPMMPEKITHWGRCKVHDLFYHIPGGREKSPGDRESRKYHGPESSRGKREKIIHLYHRGLIPIR